LDVVLAGITTLIQRLLLVPKSAAGAHAAQRHVLQAFHRTVRQKAQHIARMYPPQLSLSFLSEVDAQLRAGIVSVLGWTKEEADEAWPQCELAFEDGGLDLRPLSQLAPLLHLSAWLSATATGRLPVPAVACQGPAEFWGATAAATKQGRRMRAWYQQCRSLNPELPGSLQEFGDRVAALVDAPAPPSSTGPSASRLAPAVVVHRVRWAHALADGCAGAVLRRWRRGATKQQKTRQGVLSSGQWMLTEPPGRRSYSRTEWLVAVRFWFGLGVLSAIPDADLCATVCQNRYVVVDEDGRKKLGDTCKSKPAGRRQRGSTADAVPTPLDPLGRHGAICKVGGTAIMRHDCIRDVLGHSLRSLVSGVQWERYVHEIARVDGAEKSRLDLVVRDPLHSALLDIVVFHPLHESGIGTYKHRDYVRAKFERYNPTRDGRRQLSVPLIPMVVSTFGVVDPDAALYVNNVEQTARVRGRSLVSAPGGPRTLTQLVSYTAILECASIVTSAHSQRRFAGDTFLGAPRST